MGAANSNLLYQIPEPPSYDEKLDGLFWIEDNGMRIPAVHIEYTDQKKSPYTILYALANYQDIGRCVPWLKTVQLTLRANVMCFEYPGYGLHEGEASEKGVYSSTAAAYNYLTNNLKIDPSNIILMGNNLGSAAMIHLLYELSTSRKKTKDAVAGLVLMSTFTSLLGIVGVKAKFGKADAYENIKKIDKVLAKTFIVHAQNDTVIDPKLARKLSKKITNLWKFEVIPDQNHNDIDYSDEFLDKLIEFITAVERESDPEYTPVVVAPLVVPSIYRAPTVDKWLEELDMKQYTSKFLENGYFSMDIVKTIQQIDLEAMEIDDPVHIQTLLHGVAGLNAAPGEISGKKDDLDEDSDSNEPVYGPMEPNHNAFVEVLKSHDCELSGDEPIPKKWETSLSYASSVNIPYWEDENDQLLYKGFFGEIYKSLWNSTPVVKKKLIYKKAQMRKFCSEAILLSQLKHPNIVEVIGACMDRQSPPCLITEYVQGDNLEKFLQAHPNLPMERKVQIASDITSGLKYLHSLTPPIIHRDLTPRSVLISDDGNRAKLGDFGLGSAPSFDYMAPELFCRQAYSTSADIYSLGLLLFLLVTGKQPFEGMDGAEAAARVAKMNIRPTFPDEISLAWRNLIRNCWHRTPGQRPTAAQVLETLHSISQIDGINVPDEAHHFDSPLVDLSFLKVEEAREKEEEKVILHAGGMNYPSALLIFQYASLVNNPKYSDLIINVGNQKFHGHKAIIAARNENLAALIEQAGNANEIEITQIPPASFKHLLDFLYTGTFSVRNDNVYEVMQSANQLNIQQAVDICREYIDDHGIPIVSTIPAVEAESSSKRVLDVKESLLNVEMGIQNVETALEILNRKLEIVTKRMAPKPT